MRIYSIQPQQAEACKVKLHCMVNMASALELAKERKTPAFDQYEMRVLLYGSRKYAQKLLDLWQRMAADPVVQNSPHEYSMSREELMNTYIKKSAVMYDILEPEILSGNEILLDSLTAFGNPNPLDTHNTMFLDCLRTLATSKQRDKWIPLIQQRKMFGTYVQTELGHGSNVRGLETLAVFDKSSKEFVINTPTLTATKFWPGTLGLIATHGMVSAVLISEGNNYGVHFFLVPLRDVETHQPLKGIEVGDIGPKFGYNTMDNGYLAMHNVRVPLENMLSRFGKLRSDGSYYAPPFARLRYFVMLQTRANIIRFCSLSAAKAATIAVRYAVVRDTLQYQVQRHKLFTAIASTYAMHFLGRRIFKEVATSRENLRDTDIQVLKQLHMVTSGLKAMYTSLLLEQIEVCRQSCGGHGYSMFSGLPSLFANLTPTVTYEGDNTVMLLQCGTSLLKSLQHSSRGEKMPAGLDYLNYLEEYITHRCAVQQPNDWKNVFLVEEALKVRACALAKQLLQRVSDEVEGGRSIMELTNERVQEELVGLALAHCELVTYNEFKEVAMSQKKGNRKILKRLSLLYGLNLVKKHQVVLLQVGFFSSHHFEMCLDAQVDTLLESIRPAAVQLVDVFGYTDNALNSALGLYHGNVYETLLSWAQHANPVQSFVPEAFRREIMPHLAKL